MRGHNIWFHTEIWKIILELLLVLNWSSALLLAHLYENTESYCCHFDIGVSVVVSLQNFLCYGQGMVKVSYPVRGQVLLVCVLKLYIY